VDSVISSDIEKNEFYIVCKYAKELIVYYDELVQKKVFTESGNIDEYCAYLSEYRKEIFSDLKESSEDREKIDKALSELLRSKKEEWRLLYKSIADNPLILELRDFNYKTLKFYNNRAEKLIIHFRIVLIIEISSKKISNLVFISLFIT